MQVREEEPNRQQSGGVLTMHLPSHCFTPTQVFLAPYL